MLGQSPFRSLIDMGKYRKLLTRLSAMRLWKKKYGQGIGTNYKAWLQTRNVPSRGERNRVKGIKTDRIHQLLSHFEYQYFSLLEWADNVVDIREQYPLWHPDETQAIAKALGIDHPCPPGHDFHVMTTDFVITLKDDDGQERLIARTLKKSVDLDDSRVLEKLEIERYYWLRKNVDWGIVTELELPTNLVTNLELWLPFYKLDFPFGNLMSKSEVATYLSQSVMTLKAGLSMVARQCDFDLGLPIGTCLQLAYHLIATKQWRIDVHQPFLPSQILEIKRLELREES